MRNVALAMVCGLASAAAAQSGSFSILPSVSTINIFGSSSFTLAVFASADFGTNIAGGEFGISATGATNNISGMTGVAEAWGGLGELDRGYDGDGGHNGLVFGQLIFPPFVPPSAESALGNGAVLVATMTVSVEPDFCGFVTFTTINGQGPFALEVFDSADNSFTQLTDVGAGTATVGLLPAPSSLGLLGIAGLVAGRRRR